MKRTISTAVMSVGLVMSAQAGAQMFGEQGQFIVSADRVMGYTHSSATFDPDPPDAEVQVTQDNFAFLGQGDVVTPMFSNPRISFDYTVIDGLTLGGSLSFWTQSGEAETEAPFGTLQSDLPSSTLFVLAPRIGYIFMFSEHVGIWPRGGFSFFVGENEAFFGEDSSLSGFAFDVEVPFAFVPLPHTAIFVGPAFDATITAGGEIDPGNTDYDLSVLDFGIYAGLGIWF